MGFHGWAADEEAWEVGNGGVIHSEQEQNVEKKEGSGGGVKKKCWGLRRAAMYVLEESVFRRTPTAQGRP